MKKDQNLYTNFSSFVLRTPLLDFDSFETLTSETTISEATFLSFFQKALIKEAIFLASPTLYFELSKWAAGEYSAAKEEKLKLSLLKYLTRMSTRCTPFGLFAGCTMGSIGQETNLKVSNPSQHKRHTRPDMNYLVALSQDLAKEAHIMKQLNFYPNTSTYLFGNELRYVEYFYRESQRNHQIVQVDNSKYLEKVLEVSRTGATIHELVTAISDDEVTMAEAEDFIKELIEVQLLVSELEPSVTGTPFIGQILSILKSKKKCGQEIRFLEKLQNDFSHLDLNMGNSPEKYLKISAFAKSQPTKHELKYLFQTDLELSTHSCELSTEVVQQVMRAMVLFNKITPQTEETNLDKFKEAFIKRYEDREMPLYKVLDVETGIGYLQNTGSGDINPLVDDLILPPKESPFRRSKSNWNSVYQVLSDKLTKALKNGETCIFIDDPDFGELPLEWMDLPDTLAGLIELSEEDGEQRIYFAGMGGSSGANLLGRFSHKGTEISEFVKEITAMEDSLNPDHILAEIIHLPESRVGNILMRSKCRNFEIPYLAKSNLSVEHQIPISDLTIAVRGNHIILKSKKFDKEILPRLTNAHNFSSNALPIYQFLCDMQMQKTRGWIGFNFGPLIKQYQFLPRVQYKNIIFHKATWMVNTEEIGDLAKLQNNSRKFSNAISAFRAEWKMPQFLLLSEGDNELLINMDCHTSVKMLLETVKNRPSFKMSEFLHAKEGPVKSETSFYSNQIVLSFYNAYKLKHV